jgi:hypothetical protein
MPFEVKQEAGHWLNRRHVLSVARGRAGEFQTQIFLETIIFLKRIVFLQFG